MEVWPVEAPLHLRFLYCRLARQYRLRPYTRWGLFGVAGAPSDVEAFLVAARRPLSALLWELLYPGKP